jgi:hypothetical protein
MRKWWDMREKSGWEKSGNLVNAGKYISCIILVVVDVLQKLNPRPFVFPLVSIQGIWLAAAIVKTLSVLFPNFSISCVIIVFRFYFFVENAFSHHVPHCCTVFETHQVLFFLGL